MNSAPSIDQLKELALPEPAASYWPQTWGWALVVAVLLAVAATLCWRRHQQWRQRRYRREALLQLSVIQRALQQPSQRIEAVRRLPELIKRVALSMPGAEPCADLEGERWQAFLQRYAPHVLPADLASQFARLAYAPPAQLTDLTLEQCQHLCTTCRQWIEGHHVAT
jgi:hypothetical protein